MVWLSSAIWTVQCGNHQTFDDVLVDTGSAILWVGGENPYVQGPNTKVYVLTFHYIYMFRSYSTFIYYSINSTFGVGYGMGSVQGIAYRDTVTIGDATGNNQFIGAANQTTRFNTVRPIDGIRTSLSHFYFILFKKRLNLQIWTCAFFIVGLGPSNSNKRDISGFDGTPTFVETLVSQNQISAAIFGIYIAPLGADGTPQGGGEITFGGIDWSKIRGDELFFWISFSSAMYYY